MSKMLIELTTARQVLEALNSFPHRHLTPFISNARTALREALAEQPTTTENNGGKTGWPPGLLQDDCKGLSKWLSNQPDAKRRVREALAEQPAQQEPVGEVNRYGLDSHGRKWHGIYWYDPNVDVPHGTKLYTSPQPAQQEPIYQYQMANGSWIDQTKESHDYNVRHGQATVRVVYTSPPAQRKPLTDDEITSLWEKRPYFNDFARAIEAAHGIKGDA